MAPALHYLKEVGGTGNERRTTKVPQRVGGPGLVPAIRAVMSQQSLATIDKTKLWRILLTPCVGPRRRKSRGWPGLTPGSHDGRPICGRAPRVEGPRKSLKRRNSEKENEDFEFGFRSAGFGICSAGLGFRSEKFGFRSGEFGIPSSRLTRRGYYLAEEGL